MFVPLGQLCAAAARQSSAVTAKNVMNPAKSIAVILEAAKRAPMTNHAVKAKMAKPVAM
jgi:hypothetical protein